MSKKHGISEQTIYTWRKRFGTFQADDVRRLKQLEGENARLKKLVAERDLEIEVMKEIAAWRQHFKMVRPHSSLGYLTLAAFAAKIEKKDAADAKATGRIAAVHGAFAPRPVAQPSRKGQTKPATGAAISS